MTDLAPNSTESEQLGPGEDAEETSTASPSEAQIFVSYRLEPDEQTAVALQRLLAGAFDPPVGIFVSSAGGLRPDKLGLNPQLQRAVQTARAFVAIITPASKEREWVIFEAGAAWGRGQLYAPLLIDTKPEDLGTTIGHYVATRADSRDQMDVLIRSIADAVGATVKPRVGQRLAAFQRHLEQRAAPADAPERDDSNDGPVAQAVQLWFAGKKDEARAKFADALAQQTAREDVAQTRIVQLSLEFDDRAEFLQELERLDSETKTTASFASWRAMLEDRPDICLQLLDVVQRTPEALRHHRKEVLGQICRELLSLGREDDGTAMLTQALVDNATQDRAPLAESLFDLNPNLSPVAKLAITAVSTGGTGSSCATLMAKLTDLAIELKWLGLALFTADYRQRVKADGPARNNLGRAYATAQLHSLAYDAYRDAMNAGVSVAKTNIAAMLTYNPVPAAGLAILKEHQGDFDAASPGYPFHVRANIEDILEQERQRSRQLKKNGRKLFWRIAALAEESLRTEILVEKPNGAFVDADGKTIEFSRVAPFSRLWSGSIGSDFAGLFLFRSESECVGVRFDPTRDE